MHLLCLLNYKSLLPSHQWPRHKIYFLVHFSLDFGTVVDADKYFFFRKYYFPLVSMTLLPSSLLFFFCFGNLNDDLLGFFVSPYSSVLLPSLGFWSRLPSLALCILKNCILLHYSWSISHCLCDFQISLSPSMDPSPELQNNVSTSHIESLYWCFSYTSNSTFQMENFILLPVRLQLSSLPVLLSQSRGTTTCQLLFVLGAFHTFSFFNQISRYDLLIFASSFYSRCHYLCISHHYLRFPTLSFLKYPMVS